MTAVRMPALDLPSKLLGKGSCCRAVGMCENSRQRVIHIATASTAILLGLQVAWTAQGGEPETDGGVAVWVSGSEFRTHRF